MDVDLYLVRSSRSANQPNLLYENLGDGSFRAVPDAGGAQGSTAGLGSDVTTVDFDRDGFMNLAMRAEPHLPFQCAGGRPAGGRLQAGPLSDGGLADLRTAGRHPRQDGAHSVYQRPLVPGARGCLAGQPQVRHPSVDVGRQVQASLTMPSVIRKPAA